MNHTAHAHNSTGLIALVLLLALLMAVTYLVVEALKERKKNKRRAKHVRANDSAIFQAVRKARRDFR